jgi:hypothetical protein
MPAITVTSYALSWSILNNKGSVFLRLANNTQGQIEVDSAQELAALADILRNSSTVFFDSNGQTLETAQKPPGTA